MTAMWWRGFDPRFLLLTAVVLTISLLAAPRTALLAAGPVALVLAATVLDRTRVIALLRAVLILAAITCVINAFLGSGDRILGYSQAGLIRGAWQGVRLTALTAVAAWATAVLSPLSLAATLEWSVRRWPPLRHRVHQALLPVVLAVQLLPLMTDEAARQLEVDRLRRGPGPRSWIRQARLMPAWLNGVIDRADDLALALTLRGYRPDRPLRFMRTYAWGRAEAAGVMVLALAVWGLRP